MKPALVFVRFALSMSMLTPVFLLAQNPPAGSAPVPIPAGLLTAKRLFVSNAGTDSGLFPHPFSGDLSRGYNQLFVDLQSLGKWDLVSTPAQADLVLELGLIAPNGPKEANKQYGSADPVPMFRLVVYDRPTHYVLWTFTGSVEIALKQQTHVRNFDDAIASLVAEFQALTRMP